MGLRRINGKCTSEERFFEPRRMNSACRVAFLFSFFEKLIGALSIHLEEESCPVYYGKLGENEIHRAHSPPSVPTHIHDKCLQTITPCSEATCRRERQIGLTPDVVW